MRFGQTLFIVLCLALGLPQVSSHFRSLGALCGSVVTPRKMCRRLCQSCAAPQKKRGYPHKSEGIPTKDMGLPVKSTATHIKSTAILAKNTGVLKKNTATLAKSKGVLTKSKGTPTLFPIIL